jgi:phosphatidylethanolamine/phosphatidyl-N-methylethanolamine N-methyltransferase
MALKHSYTLLAPLYDALLSGKLDTQRKNSLARLGNVSGKNVLINGIGTGLDIPFLPNGAHYTGSDITPAMLERAQKRASDCNFNIDLSVADSQALPFPDQHFDIIVMHLILAVVPDPVSALKEAERVLKSGGHIYIFDKFIRPGQLAITRRLLNLFIRHIATRTDVVFENVLKTCPHLKVVRDEPALAKGWFRLIELRKSSVSSL